MQQAFTVTSGAATSCTLFLLPYFPAPCHSEYHLPHCNCNVSLHLHFSSATKSVFLPHTNLYFIRCKIISCTLFYLHFTTTSGHHKTGQRYPVLKSTINLEVQLSLCFCLYHLHLVIKRNSFSSVKSPTDKASFDECPRHATALHPTITRIHSYCQPTDYHCVFCCIISL